MKPEAITAVPQPRAPLDLGLLNFMYTSDTRGWGIEQACASITRDNERNKAKCQRVKMKFLLFQHSHVAVTSMSKSKSPHPLTPSPSRHQTPKPSPPTLTKSCAPMAASRPGRTAQKRQAAAPQPPSQ